MEITFVLPYFSWKPVGGYKIIYEYANRLSLRGHKVRIVEPYVMPIRYRGYVSWKVRLRRRLGEIRDILFQPRIVPWFDLDSNVELMLPKILNCRNIPDADVIVATQWNTAEFVIDCPKSKGEKFYFIQHYETWSGPKERVDATWKSALHKIVIAKWLYDLAKKMGIDDVVHIPNAIDLEKYKILEPIEDRPKKVAMMYSQTVWKGGRDGIEALKIVKEQFPRLSVILFGVGPRPAFIPKWMKYIQNPSQDVLVKNIYNGSSIYLCPSWTEGWHLPPAEAMACGCAVVSTDIGGVRDYAIDMQTALLSPPQDPAKLAKNVLKLLNDDNLRLQIAKAGYEKILSFNWDYSTLQLESFFEKYIR